MFMVVSSLNPATSKNKGVNRHARRRERGSLQLENLMISGAFRERSNSKGGNLGKKEKQTKNLN